MRGFSLQAASAGLLAAIVGFASSFAVVLQGLNAVGATTGQAASGLIALCVLQGAFAVWLSLRERMPILLAWSTPGAALLAQSAPLPGGFPEAVGAFLASGVLIVAAGLWKPLGRAVAAIPAPLANAMLAGVLLGLCLAPVRAISARPGTRRPGRPRLGHRRPYQARARRPPPPSPSPPCCSRGTPTVPASLRR